MVFYILNTFLAFLKTLTASLCVRSNNNNKVSKSMMPFLKESILDLSALHLDCLRNSSSCHRFYFVYSWETNSRISCLLDRLIFVDPYIPLVIYNSWLKFQIVVSELHRSMIVRHMLQPWLSEQVFAECASRNCVIFLHNATSLQNGNKELDNVFVSTRIRYIY